MNAIVVSGLDNWRPVPGVEHDDVTVGGTAVGIGDLNKAAKKILITVEDAPVIVTYNGTTPSASNGSVYLPQTVLALGRQMARAMKAIRYGSTNARLHVEECQFDNGARSET
jgi:hypothetical protein